MAPSQTHSGWTEISSLWELDVTPTGDDRVILTLAGSQDCTEDEAPCTSDGRTTDLDVSVQVLRPETPTTLTAQFTNLPTEHDGSSTFEVWVGFSHDLRNSYTPPPRASDSNRRKSWRAPAGSTAAATSGSS